MKFVSLTEARVKLPDLVRTAERTALTRNGQPVAIVLPVEEYKAIQAMLSLAQQSGRLDRLLEAHAQVQRGEFENFVELEALDVEADGHSVHENSAG